MHRPHRHAPVAALLIAVIALVATACSDDEPLVAPQPTTPFASTTTTAPPKPVRTQVCRTVYHAGFQITLTSTLFRSNEDRSAFGEEPQEADVDPCPAPPDPDAASTGGTGATTTTTTTADDATTTTAKKSSGSSSGKSGKQQTYEGSLVVFLSLRNLTSNAREFGPSAISLSLGGKDVPGELTGNEIPGGGKNTAYVSWSDVTGPDIGDALVTFGDANDNDAVAPLGDDDSAAVTNAPVSHDVNVTGELVADQFSGPSTLDVSISKVQVATSFESKNDDLYVAKQGEVLLFISYRVAARAGNFQGGFGTPNVSVTAPDGTSSTEELSYQDLLDPGESQDRTSVVRVPAPGTGAFTVSFTGDNPKVRAPLDLTVQLD